MNKFKKFCVYSFMVLAVTFGPNAVAEGRESGGNQKTSPTAYDVCKSFRGIAEDIMVARQRGTPMPRVVDAVIAGFEEGPARDLVMLIVKDAYDYPHFPAMFGGSEALPGLIREFADEHYARCLRIYLR